MKQNSRILDFTQNFFLTGLLPHTNYRFVLGRATALARELGAIHGASPAMSALMGEVTLGAFFLSTHTGKQESSTVSLHLECQEPVKRIMGFARSEGALRAYGVHPEARWEGDVASLFTGGILRVNRWKNETSQVYSSAVEMRGVPLDKNLEEYVGRSEQIQTFLKIVREEEGEGSGDISGYMFQALPDATADDTDAVLSIVETHSPRHILDEILSSGALERKELADRVPFLGTSILRTGQFYTYCDCNRSKIESLIIGLQREYVEEVIREEGVFEAACQFCNRRYRFSEREVDEIFEKGEGR